MKKILYWLVVVFFIAVLLPVSAGAQRQQWLHYQSSREPQTIAKYISMPFLKPTAKRLDSNELPVLNGEPLFYKWSSPLAADGFLYIVLDRETGRGVRDRLFIDSNGNGSLGDETAIKAYKISATHSLFGPVKVTFGREDDPIVYHLNFRLCDHDDRWLRVSSAGWYEGNVIVNSQQKFCVLIDHNANGTFNDKSLDAAQADRVCIGEKEYTNAFFAGNYIDIDGVLYQLLIPRDGAYVKFSRAEDVEYGIVRVPTTIAKFTVNGENGFFSFLPNNGLSSLPVGKYRVNSWTVIRQYGGELWKLQGSLAAEKGVFDITGDKETELSIGEPIISRVEAQDRIGSHVFDSSLHGRLGERIDLTRNGRQPQPPKLRIRSADGSYDKSFAFAYG